MGSGQALSRQRDPPLQRRGGPRAPGASGEGPLFGVQGPPSWLEGASRDGGQTAGARVGSETVARGSWDHLFCGERTARGSFRGGKRRPPAWLLGEG